MGEELLRIRGAGQPGESGRLAGSWLANSSGIVVGTSRSVRLVTLAGHWESVPGLPAPGDPDLFVQETTVRNREGQVLATLEFGPPSREIRGGRSTWVARGSTSRELRVKTGIFYESGVPWGLYTDAAIERPPFDDRVLVRVVVDTCLKPAGSTVVDRNDPHLPPKRHGGRDGRLPDLLDAHPHRRRPRGLGERGVPALVLRRRAAGGIAARAATLPAEPFRRTRR